MADDGAWPRVGAAPRLRHAPPRQGATPGPRPDTTDARPGDDGWDADALEATGARVPHGHHASGRAPASHSRAAACPPRGPPPGPRAGAGPVGPAWGARPPPGPRPPGLLWPP